MLGGTYQEAPRPRKTRVSTLDMSHDEQNNVHKETASYSRDGGEGGVEISGNYVSGEWDGRRGISFHSLKIEQMVYCWYEDIGR